VPLDADYRRACGEVVRPEDYLGRFPELDPTWLAGALADAGDRTTPPEGGSVQPANAPAETTAALRAVRCFKLGKEPSP
jgi:hypothetical protein